MYSLVCRRTVAGPLARPTLGRLLRPQRRCSTPRAVFQRSPSSYQGNRASRSRSPATEPTCVRGQGGLNHHTTNVGTHANPYARFTANSLLRLAGTSGPIETLAYVHCPHPTCGMRIHGHGRACAGAQDSNSQPRLAGAHRRLSLLCLSLLR